MKKTNKVCVNLTQEEYDLLKRLATIERRTPSELAAMILVDNAILLFLDHQQKGTMEQARFCPNEFRTVNPGATKGEEK